MNTNWYIILLLTAVVFVNVLIYVEVSGPDKDSDDFEVAAAVLFNWTRSVTKKEPASAGKMGPTLYEYSYALPGTDHRRIRSKRHRYWKTRRARYAGNRSYHRPYMSHTYGGRGNLGAHGINPFYEDTDRWRVMY